MEQPDTYITNPPQEPVTLTYDDLVALLEKIAEQPWRWEPEIVHPAEYARRAADPLWTNEGT